MGCTNAKNKPHSKADRAPTQATDPAPAPPQRKQTRSLEIKAGQFVQLLKEPIYRQYTITKLLGEGSFGKVYLAEQKTTHQKRAIKEIDKALVDTKSSNTKFIKEVEILSQLDHPNILKVFELFEDPQRYYMVTEACEGGELFSYLERSGRLNENLAAHVMYQLFNAVCYCHKQQIVHRDLKPENLLIESLGDDGKPTIKVIDFGTSTLMGKNEKLRTRLGTPYYIAPEVLRMDYNEKCDIWSCGVILYILLSGQPPFNGSNNNEIIAAIQKGVYTFNDPVWNNISEEAKAFVRRLLELDYTRRVSAQDCLKDPWMRRSYEEQHSSVNLRSLENLKSFNSGAHLQQAFMSFIVAQLLTKEHTNQLKAEFVALDTDGDGRLSRAELLEGYSHRMPLEEAERVVNDVLSKVDTDGNGFIEYSEFITAAINHETLLSRANLEQAFKACDRDHSGSISVAELKEMLGGGNVANEQVWNQLISEADSDGNGEIDLKEFTNIMLRAADL